MQESEKPLHTTLHYRKIREIISSICHSEGISESLYDAYKITAYRSYGQDMKGQYVKTIGTNNGCSMWVSNNKYEVLEVPAKKNAHKSINGAFLVLARNVNFNYWVVAEMEHFIDKNLSRERQQIVSKVTYKPIGKYLIFQKEHDQILHKECFGSECDFGGTTYVADLFDLMHVRKKAYGKDHENMLSQLLYRTNAVKNSIIDEKQVEIYKKKKNNGNRRYH